MEDKKNDQKALGKAIEAGRVRERMEPKAFAKLMGVSTSTISKWELGASAPRLRRWEQLKRVIGVDAEQYLSESPVQKVTGTDSHQIVAGRDQSIKGVILSPGETYFVELLRKKDTDGKLLNEFISKLLLV